MGKQEPQGKSERDFVYNLKSPDGSGDFLRYNRDITIVRESYYA